MLLLVKTITGAGFFCQVINATFYVFIRLCPKIIAISCILKKRQKNLIFGGQASNYNKTMKLPIQKNPKKSQNSAVSYMCIFFRITSPPRSIL